MEITALILLILCSLLGFIAIFFTTFGTLIILGGAVFYAVATEFQILAITDLVLLLTLYLAGEVLEYLFVVIGAKKFGASNWAVVGALGGGIFGAILGTPLLGIGIISGTFLGIFLGAFLVELVMKKDVLQSLKVGAGSLLGRMGSIVMKVLIAIVMFVLIGTKMSSTWLS